MAARLHDHVSLEAQEVAQLEKRFLRCIAGRVFALRRVREHLARSKYVAMGIDRPRRCDERGMRRMWMIAIQVDHEIADPKRLFRRGYTRSAFPS